MKSYFHFSIGDKKYAVIFVIDMTATGTKNSCNSISRPREAFVRFGIPPALVRNSKYFRSAIKLQSENKPETICQGPDICCTCGRVTVMSLKVTKSKQIYVAIKSKVVKILSIRRMFFVREPRPSACHQDAR